MIKIPKSAMKRPSHVAPRFLVVRFPFIARSTMRKKPMGVQEISSRISAGDDRGYNELIRIFELSVDEANDLKEY